MDSKPTVLGRATMLAGAVALMSACSAGSELTPRGPLEPVAEVGPERAKDAPPPAKASGGVIVSKEPMSLEAARTLAADDLASRLGHRNFSTAQSRHVTWRDGSIGCPQPGRMYAQVLTPGYLIVFEADGRSHRYHGRSRGVPEYCPAGVAKEPLEENPDA